jgi:hypothetical protein
MPKPGNKGAKSDKGPPPTQVRPESMLSITKTQITALPKLQQKITSAVETSDRAMSCTSQKNGHTASSQLSEHFF